MKSQSADKNCFLETQFAHHVMLFFVIILQQIQCFVCFHFDFHFVLNVNAFEAPHLISQGLCFWGLHFQGLHFLGHMYIFKVSLLRSLFSFLFPWESYTVYCMKLSNSSLVRGSNLRYTKFKTKLSLVLTFVAKKITLMNKFLLKIVNWKLNVSLN